MIFRIKPTNIKKYLPHSQLHHLWPIDRFPSWWLLWRKVNSQFLLLLLKFQQNSDSNPGLAHEGPSCVLLFQASWHGWQLLWPLGNPNRPPTQPPAPQLFGHARAQAVSVAHRPCAFWSLLFRHHCKCLPFGHPVLLSAQVAFIGFFIKGELWISMLIWLRIVTWLNWLRIATWLNWLRIATWLNWSPSQTRHLPLPLLSHAWPWGAHHSQQSHQSHTLTPSHSHHSPLHSHTLTNHHTDPKLISMQLSRCCLFTLWVGCCLGVGAAWRPPHSWSSRCSFSSILVWATSLHLLATKETFFYLCSSCLDLQQSSSHQTGCLPTGFSNIHMSECRMCMVWSCYLQWFCQINC